MATSRTPSLEEVLRLAIDNSIRGVHVSIPGIIEKYDSSSQTADVKPTVQNVIMPDNGGEDIIESLPVITGVPVLFPSAGGFFLSLPVKKGDTVLLVFSERSIDSWLDGNGGEVNPIDVRHHDLSDAVAILGFTPNQNRIQDASSSDLVIGKDGGGLQVAISSDNKMTVKIGAGATVEFESTNAGAKMTLGTGAVSVAIAENLQILWTLLSLWASTHTHQTPVGPSSPPQQAAAFPPWQANIVSTSTKVPS